MAELQPKPLAPPLVRRVLRGALAGLIHVHRNGVIHRDISPNNIFVFKIRWIEGRPKVDLKAVKGAQVGDETTFKVVGPYEAAIVLRIVAKPSMARGDVERGC